MHLLSTVVSILLLAVALGCASTPESEQPPELESAQVVLVPLNVGIAREPLLDGKSALVGRELLAYLQDQGAQVSVLMHDDAMAIWDDAVGQSPGSSFHDAASAFARDLASEGEFDWLVFPAVVVRKAEVHGSTAHWDGVRRTLESDQPSAHRSHVMGLEEVQFKGLDGRVSAASLHVLIVDREGRIAFEGLSGLSLLQRVELAGDQHSGSWHLADEDEPLRDLDQVREGIEMAFDKRLKRRASAW